MIKSIYLENWKTHQNSKLSFKKGTNLIVGNIGSGKSSIIDGVCYALYGNFPSLQNRKISLTENIMFKPAKMEFTKIILELSFNDKEYRIEREIYLGSKANLAKLYLDNKLIAGPKQTDVNDKVSEILGIDYNLFSKIVYSEQNELDYFLKIQPSKRKEKFDELFGINHLKEIKEDSKKLEHLSTIEIDKRKVLFNQIDSQLKNYDFSYLESKQKETKEKLKNILDELSDFKIKKTNLEKELVKVKDLKSKFESVTLQININLSKLKEIEQKIQQHLLKAPELLKDDFKTLLINKEETLIKKEQEYKSFFLKNKDLEVLEKDLVNKSNFYLNEIKQNKLNQSKFLETLYSTDSSLEDVLKSKEKIIKDIDEIKEKQITLNSKTLNLKKSIQELKKGFANCPVCDSKLTPEQINSALQEKEKEEKSIFLELTSLKDLFFKLNSEKQALELVEKKILENKNILSKIKDLEFSENKLKDELEKINNNLEKIEKPKDLSILEKNISSLKEEVILLKEFLNFTENKNTLSKELILLKENLSKISFNEETYLSLVSEQKNVDSKFTTLNDNKIIYNNLLEKIEKDINIYKKLDFQKQNLEKELSILEIKKTDLSFFSRSLEISQHQLRKVLIDNINQALSIIWPKVYAYKDYKSARLQADNDYILEVLSLEGEWLRVEGILSGGERSCAALSIRVAIALVLTERLGLLILDEPTHNLDENSINSLSSILENDLPDLVDQIFIITHDSLLLETFNSSKFIINRDKENDGVSLIEEK